MMVFLFWRKTKCARGSYRTPAPPHGAHRLYHMYIRESEREVMALRALFAIRRGMTHEQRDCCAETWARVLMDEPVGRPRSW